MSKKLLVVGPFFFGYKDMIVENVSETRSFDVVKSISDVLPFYSLYNFFCKKSAFLNSLCTYVYNLYFIFYVKVFRPTDVFVILGRSVSKSSLLFLKRKNINVTLYMWDSLEYYPSVHHVTKLYDRVYTFDKVDAEKHSFTYEPLFFNSKLVSDNPPVFDFVFIGSVHGDRLEKVHKFKEVLKKSGASLKVHFYMPSYIHYFKAFYVDKKSKYGFSFQDFFFRAKSIKESYDCYASGKCILDIPNSKQNGYTMRTFEVLGSNRKIITTSELLMTDVSFDSSQVYSLDLFLNDTDVTKILSEPFANSHVIDNQELSKWVSRVILNF